MSHIAYDPVKDKFAAVTACCPLLRRILYFLLDMMFLRSWYARKIIAEHVAELNTKGQWSILDAGSGFGQYDRFFLAKFNNAKLTAIDIKKNYLRHCERYFKKDIERRRAEFLMQDLQTMQYERQFDLVTCIDVLEHIEDDETVMQNIAEALKENGLFFMHSPSSCYDAGKEAFVEEHFRLGYDKAELEKKLKKVGLIPLKTGYTYGKPGHLAWVLGIKIPLLMFSKLKLIAVIFALIYFPLVLPLFLLLNLIDMKSNLLKGRGIYALSVKNDRQS